MTDVGWSLREAVRLNPAGIAARTLADDGRQIAAEASRFPAHISWAELQDEVGLLSKILVEMPAVEAGDRLGVLGRNSPDYLKLMYACADAGVIFVPLNTRWAISELRHAVVDSGIKAIAVLDREFVDVGLSLSAAAPAGASGVSSLLVGPLACSSRLASTAPREISRWQPFHLGGSDRAEDEAPSEEWNEADDGRGQVTSARGGEQDGQQQRLLQGPHLHDSTHGIGGPTLDNADDTGDVFCIVYTSGSTGRSKGVALTHAGQILQATAKCVHVGYTSSTTYLNILPLFHVGGISSTLAVTLAGGCHVFVPRFSPISGSAAVRAGRVNSIVVVPTMLHMIIQGSSSKSCPSDSDGLPLGAVDTVVVGGQRITRRLERRARRFFPTARFIQTYACTEAGSTITFCSSSPFSHGSSRERPGNAFRRHSSEKPGSRTVATEEAEISLATAGSPAKHVEIRVVERGAPGSSSSACPAAAGTVGEVETRGAHVMKGYWRRPDLTAEALSPDGWLRTGDLGRLDEATGRLEIVGRVKDVIKTGGEKVHSSEVESVLLRHTWVAEAAAYGVDDERLGEKVAASVVLDDAAHDEEGAITCDRARTVLDRFCGLHLSHYKRPRQIDVVPALPRNSSGKVLRHMLRASL
ncbi:unnamed protein product [Hapterophycus canaliculatus]